ncbi:hypothetical protein PDESU_00854 [Pontiella desulfatans]|uniref:Lipocalin-like domain-containing protein n=1 Tax=Pontiella desulfatans TaxID=2750659 RepID=A0A6C2TXG3_PONDE|nr:hypothetical protein [Pontiella desulfatans]VGO12303.1 hypothetical protein PDESU_00854 [Pontiella desulfatans]
MKTRTKWSSILKQTLIVAFGVVCMAGMMGCGGDDGGGDEGINLEGTWEYKLTAAGISATDTYLVPFPAELSKVVDLKTTIPYDGNVFELEIYGGGKKIRLDMDLADGDRAELDGDIHSSTSMSGTGTYYPSDVSFPLDQQVAVEISIAFTWSAKKL